MYREEYDFGGKKQGDGIAVSAACLYEEARGYGLLPLEAMGQRPDRFTGSGGWYAGGGKRQRGEGQLCELLDSEYGVCTQFPEYPLRFRAKVPGKGVYRVEVTLRGGSADCGRLDVYTNRRNLVKRGLQVRAGEEVNLAFYVSVCEYIPVIGEPMKLDASIYVTLIEAHQSRGSGKKPLELRPEAVSLVRVSVAEAAAPTVFLAGDSLVTDYDGQYPDNPLMNFGSWGQNLLSFLPGAAVSNQAHGGMTTNCFRDDGHFEIVRRNIRPGDVFMMQFGHNDQKRRNLKAYVQYAANLRWYISRIREMGAYPVIVTSLSRIPGRDEDGYFDLLEEYAQSCLRVGKECHVPVIDLHAYSFQLMCKVGVEASRDYFCDMTHTNDYGAMVAAGFIAGEIGKRGIEPLASWMEAISEPRMEGEALPDASWKPDAALRPVGALLSTQKEERPVLPANLPELPYADCRHIRQKQELKEAMWRGLLDPCIRYYHPFDEMPRGQFLYLFFKAVPMPKRRGYQGAYCDIYRYEWDASAVQAALDNGLVDESTTPDGHFRPDDALTCGELVSFLIRSLYPEGKRDIPMWECEKEARSLGLLWEGYQKEKAVNRLDCTVALVHLMRLSPEEKASAIRK